MNDAAGSEDRRRWIDLEGAFNFRDVGGYLCDEGTMFRWGSVFRSDALHYLTQQDVRSLQSLGVDRIIDLRSPQEIEMVGRGLLTDGPFTYTTAAVLPSTDGEALGAPSGDDISRRYLWYLEIGGEQLIAALTGLAEFNEGAVVFHCAAGKDRTGVLAALLQSLLGVSEDDIVADYALTDQALPAILDRLGRDPVHAETIASMPENRRRVYPETMRRFLESLRDEFGGAYGWARDAGLSDEVVEALRRNLRQVV